jgi:hypothetical protein
MFAIVDLSFTRRASHDFYNKLLFEAKLNHIDISRFNRTALLIILMLLSMKEEGMAYEANLIKVSTTKSYLTQLFETYGIPTSYALFELLKMKNHILLYTKEMYRSLGKNNK